MPVKNVRELKSQLRAKYKKIRKSCPPEKKQQLDLALQNAFLASEEYKSCDVLFAVFQRCFKNKRGVNLNR